MGHSKQLYWLHWELPGHRAGDESDSKRDLGTCCIW